LLPAACAAVAFEEVRYAKLLSRQRAESERLRDSEMRFRNAFQEASVGMVILDVDGRVQSVNKGFTDLLHYTPGELDGKSLFDYISPEHHADVKQQREAILAGQIPNYRAERRFIRRDGGSVWVRTSVSMLQIDSHCVDRPCGTT
jgi:PAS domain S-box-containing protein